MATQQRTGAQRRVDWLPRSVMAGFTGSVAMMIAFFISLLLVRALTNLALADRRGAAEFHAWLLALAYNPVIDYAASSVYAAGVLHIIAGMAVAMVYAYLIEPHLIGPGWVRGMLFAIIPWLLSVIVFLPLVGAGPLGLGLGAGPLPAIGNLILHLVYGSTLGAVYGELGDRPADHFATPGPGDDTETVVGYETGAAVGIIVGGFAGGILGFLAIMLTSNTGELHSIIPPSALALAGVAAGAAFGGTVGSFAGMGSSRHE